MNGFVDLHTHILPWMDDGAASLKESLAMAAMAAAHGTEVIGCTSHANGPRSAHRYDAEDFVCNCEDLQWELDQEGIPLRLAPGMEIYAGPETPEQIRENVLIPLGKSNYYLIEFPFGESPERMTDIIAQIRADGNRVITAHPERYDCIQSEPELAGELIQAGALLQCNGGSLLRQFGRSAARAAGRILEAQQYALIGSDAHDLHRRTTNIYPVYRYLSEQYGRETADRLMKENPRRILENEKTA